jgi:NADH dehydrogenase
MSRRIVVLGGGFAGVSAAQELAKQLRKQHRLAAAPARRRFGRSGPPPPSDQDGVEVLLLNRDNYFVFQPLLADIISGTIEATHVVVPLRRMLQGVSVEVGLIERIDTRERRITLRRRSGSETFSVDYDALVIALGGVTNLAAVPGMAEHGITVRTLSDAIYLRNRALEMLEEARVETDPERRARQLTFVVVGGGSTGVEVAAELRDLVDTAAASFTDVKLEPRVVLVHGQQVVLSDLGDRLGRYTTRKLADAGIELRLGRRVRHVDASRVTLDDGAQIDAATIVSTVGNAPNPALAGIDGAHDERGWLTPDATFALPGAENVWVLGDCASIVDPKTGKPMPATAQHAIREGPHAARNVLAALDGKPQTPFGYDQLGMLVSVGRYKAVGDILGIKVSGFVGWVLWRSYYLLRLPTFERRLRVVIDWTLDLVLKPDIVEISLRRTRARPGEAPGEMAGEPVSVGARPDASEELTL